MVVLGTTMSGGKIGRNSLWRVSIFVKKSLGKEIYNMSPTIANNIIYEYSAKKDYLTVGLTGRREKSDACLVLLFII